MKAGTPFPSRVCACGPSTGTARLGKVTGAGGGRLAGHADLILKAPSQIVARIQEVHSLSIHVICEALDELVRAGEAR